MFRLISYNLSKNVTCLITVELLQDLGTDLCSDNESLQASVSYIFIFLFDVERDVSGSLPAPVLHKVNCGVIKLLSRAEKICIQTNALGNMYFMIFGSLLKLMVDYILISSLFQKLGQVKMILSFGTSLK